MTREERVEELFRQYPVEDEQTCRDAMKGGRYALVEEFRRSGLHHLSAHDSLSAVAHAWKGQEFPEDWNPLLVVDLELGWWTQPTMVFDLEFGPWTKTDETEMPYYVTEVGIYAPDLDAAKRVMAERLGHDEDYGFDYRITGWMVSPA